LGSSLKNQIQLLVSGCGKSFQAKPGSLGKGRSKAEPNDIDVIIVVAPDHDFFADISPAAYNVLSKQRVHRRFGFDLLVAREDSVEYRDWTDFFQQVRLEPGLRKGILRLRL